MSNNRFTEKDKVGAWFITACFACVVGAASSLVAMFAALSTNSLLKEQIDPNRENPVLVVQPCSRTENTSFFGLSRTRTEVGNCERQ